MQANTPSYTANSAASYANSAFIVANTANSTATSAGSYANSAFGQANSAATYANGAFAQANAAFAAANTGGSAYYIRNGTSNVYFASANGNILANVAGNTVITISTAGIITSGSGSGDISGANNIYSNNFIGANGIVVAGINVVPYIQSAFGQANSSATYANGAFAQANAAFAAANTGGSAYYIRNGTSNVYFTAANGSILANVAGNTIITVTANGFTTSGTSGDISGANNIYANNFIAANGVVSAGINVVPYLQSAFGQANSAATYANGAFAQANAAFNAANTGGSAYYIRNGTSNVYFAAANGNILANVAGNTVLTISATAITTSGSVPGDISGANNIYSNTIIAYSSATVAGVNVVPYIQSIFTQANSAYGSQNTTGTYANAAFTVANTANTTATSAGSYANAAFTQANTDVTNISITSGTFGNSSYIPIITVSANGRINSISTIASAGGGGGAGTDQYARDTANAAFIKANSAYAQANTGGGGSGGGSSIIAVDTYTANGAQTTFALSYSTSSNYVIVNIDGVLQLKSAYSVSGNTITFTGTPANTAVVEITTLTGTNLSYYNRTYTGDNTSTTFTTTTGVSNASIIVTENGIVQEPGVDYYISGANVIFTTAPSTGVKIGIRELASTALVSANIQFAYDQANAAFLKANTPDYVANSAALYANGAFAQANAAYNQANTDYTTITVTGGVYGNSNTIPVITVAANGRITAISNVASSGGSGGGGGVNQTTTIILAKIFS